MNYTLENFIKFCGDMEIVEEGSFTLLVDSTKKTWDIYKYKFNNTKTNKEKIAVLKDMKKSIEHFEYEFKQTEIGFFDRQSVRKAFIIISSISVCIGSIYVGLKIPKSALAQSIALFGTSAGALSAFSGSLVKVKDSEEVKKELLEALKNEKGCCDELIHYLSTNDVATEGLRDVKKKIKRFMRIHRENRRINKEHKKILNEIGNSGMRDSNFNFNMAFKNAKDSNDRKKHPKTYQLIEKIAKELTNEYNSECKSIKLSCGGNILFEDDYSYSIGTSVYATIYLEYPSIEDMYDVEWDKLLDAIDTANERIWDRYKNVEICIDDLYRGIVLGIKYID